MNIEDNPIIKKRMEQFERDSIKNHTRQLEKSRHIEETFLYFNPIEK